LEFGIGQKQPEAGMLIGMIIFFRVPKADIRLLMAMSVKNDPGTGHDRR